MREPLIPIIVVDDTHADRYIARRRLARSKQFDPIMEVATGETFLDAFFTPPMAEQVAGRTVVVLMDINMPRLDGFETISALDARLNGSQTRDRVMVMIFTSSNSDADRQRAAGLPLVKGYIVKPLDESGVAEIERVCEAA
jgi:CheY-like chemotaxis protein